MSPPDHNSLECLIQVPDIGVPFRIQLRCLLKGCPWEVTAGVPCQTNLRCRSEDKGQALRQATAVPIASGCFQQRNRRIQPLISDGFRC